MNDIVVIGAGPAGLMAAQAASDAGARVTLCEAKPSVGRKFLMAGKSGLNLTKDEAHPAFMAAFTDATARLAPMIDSFDAVAVQDWARELGQEIFTGSTGRVFPKAMKASPLLRAWLARLNAAGVEIKTRWRWTGWTDGALTFDTPDGPQTRTPDATVLALGGASWARLGSDGAWVTHLTASGVSLAPFAPANAGIDVRWSDHMAAHLGKALKGIALSSGPYHSRGEALLSHRGLEGGGIYSVSRGLREGHDLEIDLLPDLTAETIQSRLQRPQGKASMANVLRKTLKLDPIKAALLNEMARPVSKEPALLAALLKSLPVKHNGLRPMDEAISTAGGIDWEALDNALMLKAMPGVFVAGEMLDWEAPTGGYLISACLATGRWAGSQAAAFSQTPRA